MLLLHMSWLCEATLGKRPHKAGVKTKVRKAILHLIGHKRSHNKVMMSIIEEQGKIKLVCSCCMQAALLSKLKKQNL